MPLSIRPFAVSLTVALLGAVGVVSAGPAAAAQDPQASPPQRQSAPPQAQSRERNGRPPVRRQEARQDARPAPRRQQAERSRYDQLVPRERRHGESMLSDSIRRVERRTRGQVLSAESMPYEGRSVNRIKVIDETGRVRVIVDDPQASGSRPRTRRDDD